jgi:hypothetical protein
VPSEGCFLVTGPTWNDQQGIYVYTCGTQPVDCGKLICTGLCACTPGGCTVNSQTSIPVDAALSEDGHDLVGTILLADEGARTIRLKR